MQTFNRTIELSRRPRYAPGNLLSGDKMSNGIYRIPWDEVPGSTDPAGYVLREYAKMAWQAGRLELFEAFFETTDGRVWVAIHLRGVNHVACPNVPLSVKDRRRIEGSAGAVLEIPLNGPYNESRPMLLPTVRELTAYWKELRWQFKVREDESGELPDEDS